MTRPSTHASPKNPDAPHQARKRFGQNFLVDQHYIQKIRQAVGAKPGEHVLEIGPGQAALTRELIADAVQIHAVEIDRDLAARLQTTFTPEQLILHLGDAMEFDFSTLPAPLRVVGNLPYNISTPILFRLCEFEDRIHDMLFMLQKEVVDRMAAGAGDDARGRLSVMLQYRYRIEKCFDVPPGAFRPIPSVDSSIVRLTPLGSERHKPKNEAHFAQIVLTAFTQRRKMLRKSLAAFMPQNAWEEINVLSTARAEELTVEEWVRIADYGDRRGQTCSVSPNENRQSASIPK